MNWESFKLGSKENSTILSSYQSPCCYLQPKSQKRLLRYSTISENLFVCYPGQCSIFLNAVHSSQYLSSYHTWHSTLHHVSHHTSHHIKHIAYYITSHILHSYHIPHNITHNTLHTKWPNTYNLSQHKFQEILIKEPFTYDVSHQGGAE